MSYATLPGFNKGLVQFSIGEVAASIKRTIEDWLSGLNPSSKFFLQNDQTSFCEFESSVSFSFVKTSSVHRMKKHFLLRWGMCRWWPSASQGRYRLCYLQRSVLFHRPPRTATLDPPWLANNIRWVVRGGNSRQILDSPTYLVLSKCIIALGGRLSRLV